jgi:hypothetical protein
MDQQSHPDSQPDGYKIGQQVRSHSLSTKSSDPKVINVGDIVRVRIQPGRRFDFVEDLVRKCDAPAAPSENHDWNIGCKTYRNFTKWGHNGYAGERYFLTTF